MRTKTFIGSFILCALVLSHAARAQRDATYFTSSAGVQRGYGVKAVIDISRVEGFAFRVGFTGGIGGFVGDRRMIYPSLNGDLMIFRGGMGGGHPGLRGWKGIDIEALVSYTLTLGDGDRLRLTSDIRPGVRNYPLYYFGNWCYPSLQNPFDVSVSGGGNAIFFLTKQPRRKHQLVGFLNVHVSRVQVNYTNDGPPFGPPLGDQYDRFHTGGGFVTYHGDDHWPINLVEVGYNKFTGYDHSSYELSNKLGHSYVFYKDSTENHYNKSNLQLNIGNTSRFWGVSIAALNFRELDIQHLIHLKRYFSLHLVPYDDGMSFGPAGYFVKTQIGLE